jgi:hypothetical protein
VCVGRMSSGYFGYYRTSCGNFEGEIKSWMESYAAEWKWYRTSEGEVYMKAKGCTLRKAEKVNALEYAKHNGNAVAGGHGTQEDGVKCAWVKAE